MAAAAFFMALNLFVTQHGEAYLTQMCLNKGCKYQLLAVYLSFSCIFERVHR